MPRTEPDNDIIYWFDHILVEPAAHRLQRDGRDVPVEPKAYTVLLTLLHHAGEMVSKDTLLDSVWGHHHVSTGVLNRVVSQLRRALGDSPAQPRYIATVHSLGYRFIGVLQPAPAAAPVVDNEAAAPPRPVAASAPPAFDARAPYRRRFADGDTFLQFIDLQTCLNQLANWAALLPPGDTLRQAILTVLQLEYARLRAGGAAPVTLLYNEAVLAALAGDRQTALAALGLAIDEGACDELALRRDLAWRTLAGDPDFCRQQRRLGNVPTIATSPRPSPPEL